MAYTFKAVLNGNYYDLPDYQNMSFGYDFNDVGAISFGYARNGLNADIARTPYTMVIPFWDGAELLNSRFFVQAVDDSKDPEDVYFTVKGRTLFDIFRKVVTRKPGEPGKSYRFTNATPGGILNTLFIDAQARGAMQGITWNFTSSKTSVNTDWEKQITIEYKPGTAYDAILRNMGDQGLIDFMFTGTTFQVVNPDEASVDFSVPTPSSGSQIELRAGLDYEELPLRMSVEDRRNYSLLIGNNELWDERTRNDEPLGPFGREEQAVSQGSMNDAASMALVNDAVLSRVSRTKNEYTRKVIVRDGGPVPGVDYILGDWILDRPGDGLPTRFRVMRMTIGVDDRGQVKTASIVLNDRLQEWDLRIARKVDGIIGGATADGTGGGIPTGNQEDYTIPGPPTGLLASSAVYTDNDGAIRGAATTTWLNPLKNTDGTDISDLSHFEIEHQTDGTLTYDAPNSLSPMKESEELALRFDRRGAAEVGWVGADGGGNAANTNGEVFHSWGDSYWGKLTAGGKRNATMLRNTMTSFSVAGNKRSLSSYAGVENLVQLPAARCDSTASPWAGLTNATASVVSWAGGYNGKAIQLSSTATGTVAIHSSVTRTTSQGNVYKPIRAGKTYRVMCSFNTTVMGSPRVNIIWHNEAGSQISTVGVGAVSNVVDSLVVAPANAVTALFQVLGTATAASQTIQFSMPGLFETNHQMQNWRLPAQYESFTNLFTNPDAWNYSATRIARTNYSKNPSFYTNLSGVSSSGNATFARDLVNVYGVEDDSPQVDVVNPAVLNKWQTAVNNRATAQANWVVMGDSVSAGLVTSDWHNRYQTRLFDTLRKIDYPTTGVVPNNRKLGYEGMLGFVPGYFTADPWCPSLPGLEGTSGGGDFIKGNGWGMGGQTLHMGPGAYIRFTAMFDDLTVQYVNDAVAGADVTLFIDNVPYTLPGRTTGSNYVVTNWNAPKQTLKMHTVEIRNGLFPGAWASVLLCGLFFYAGDKGKGVHVWDAAKSGVSANEFATNKAGVAAGIAQAAPSLVSIELGYNDAYIGRTPAQYKTDMLAIIAEIKSACTAAGKPVPAFLLIAGYDPGPAMYGNQPEPWQNYVAAMRSIATADTANVAMVDLTTAMPQIGDDTTGLYGDAIHPSDKGNALMARILRGVVAPSSVVNKRASVRVTTAASTANSGVTVATYDTLSNWAAGDKFTYSAYVKGPAGAKLGVYSGGVGYTTASTVTLTGGFDRVVASGTVAASPTNGPQLVIRTPDATQGSFTYWVSAVQLEKSAAPTPYFDGASPAGQETYAWTGTAYVSTSTAAIPVPTGFAASAGGLLSRSTDVVRYKASCLKADFSASTIAPYVTWQAATTVGGATASCWVYTTVATTFSMCVQNGGTVLVTGKNTYVPANTWTQVRAEGNTSSAGTQAVLRSANNTAVFYVDSATTVDRVFPGGPFSGDSKNAEGITCSWSGTPHASTSIATWKNTNYVEVGYSTYTELFTADYGVQLMNSTSLPNGVVGQFLRPTDSVMTEGSKLLTMYAGVMSDPGIPSGSNVSFDGTFYLAEHDSVNKKLLRYKQFSRDTRGGSFSINWAAMVNYQGWVYIMGHRQNSAGTFDHYLLRVSETNAFGSSIEYRTASTWVATTSPGEIDFAGTPPKIILTTPNAGISALRVFNGRLRGLVIGGLSTSLKMWSAPSIDGTWTEDGTIWTSPDGRLGYSPKFQQGTDDNAKGYGALVSMPSGGSVTNPADLLPTWLRGPKGAPVPNSGAVWIDRQRTEGSPFIKGGLVPGSVYVARVRAVDNAGNVSSWAGTTPIVVAQDTQGPNRPSKPLVYPNFQGVRVIWDGLDDAGSGMPGDYAYYEVHLSTNQSFLPTSSTRVDKLRTAGGVTPVADLTYGMTYWARIVAYDTAGNASEPSEASSATPQRLSDADLPDKLITGAKIADGAINTTKLTVGAFSNNLVPNGNMEDRTSSGGIAGWNGYFNEDPQVASNGQIAGTGSLSYNMSTSNKTVLSRVFPVTPGDIYYVSAKVKTSRVLDAGSMQVFFSVADTEANAGAGFGLDTRFSVGATTGNTTVTTIEGSVEVPWIEGINFGRIVLYFVAEGIPYVGMFDDIEVRKIVGEAAIANASINSAKIKNLAVDDAKIANLNVGKLTAGQLWADVAVAARIMTALTGKRSLMDRDGFHSYDSNNALTFDTTNGSTWMKGILEASEIRGGMASFPSPWENAPGRTTITKQGLVVDNAETNNLCPNPSFKSISSVTASSGTTTSSQGAASYDFAWNIDLKAYDGKSALKVWNTTSSGYVEVPIGVASANKTYTVSWYSSATRIDNKVPDSAVYGDFNNMGVVRGDNNNRIATGRSGFLIRNGAYQGLWEQPRTSGYDILGYTGQYIRTWLTFTTPADLPAGTALRLRLPAPRTSGGGNETVKAVVYDCVQFEEKPWMTRYCDGDQPECYWLGTPHNSTSTRTSVRALWVPNQDEPVFNGKLSVAATDTRRIKVGSGSLHGTNGIEVYIWENWQLFHSGGGTWWGINFDAPDRNQARVSADDGDIHPVASRDFYVPSDGWYVVSATITWPTPTVANGKNGLRLRFGRINTPDNEAVIKTATMQEGNTAAGSSNTLQLHWAGYLWEGYRIWLEGYQTTHSTTVSMPGLKNTGAPPQFFSMVQVA